MPTASALVIVLAIAIVVLYLGLAATLREVRELRQDVSALRAGVGRDQALEINLGDLVDHASSKTVVAAVDQNCPLCLTILENLARNTSRTLVPVIVLAHGDLRSLRATYPELDIREGADGWSKVAHLTPPILMVADGSGAVRHMQLPVNESQAQAILQEWTTNNIERARRDDVA